MKKNIGKIILLVLALIAAGYLGRRGDFGNVAKWFDGSADAPETTGDE